VTALRHFRPLVPLLFFGLLLAACATPAKKEAAKTVLDEQGVHALVILAQYLFPPHWDETVQVSVARRMLPLEYHGSTDSEKTLIQSKVSFNTGALQKLLADTRRTTPSFQTIPDIEGAFGKDSHHVVDPASARRQLAWWQPGRQKNAAYYFWTRSAADRPTTRVWLQVSDGAENAKTVYVRIEAE